MPWTPQWWAVVLARGLRARGHTVTVVVDGTECPAAFAGCTLRIAQPQRIHLGAHPAPFLGLVRQVRAESPEAVLLSLSPMVPGDLWLPVEPAPAAVVRRLIRDLKPVSLVLELLHHPWLPFEAWAAVRAGDPRARTLSFAPGPHALPRVSTLTDPEVLAAHAAAPRVRSALGLTPDRLNVILPVVEVVPRTLLPLLKALARPGLRVLLPTVRPHTVARLAARAGLTGAVPMGLTASFPQIAAACEVAIAGPAAGRGESGGRWVADAMRLGLPVLADPQAAGAELIDRLGGGVVVREGWPQALDQASDAAWRAAASRTLGASAALLSPEALLERIEALAAERAAGPAMVGPRGRPAADG